MSDAATAAEALDGGLDALRRAYAAGLSIVEVATEVRMRIDGAGDPAIWIHVEPAEELRRAAVRIEHTAARDLPLWGIPFAVKDNIDVQGRITTSGVPGLARRAHRSATVVQRLLDAGALYVGKTNLDQLATGLVGTRSPYGTPRNPLDPERIPGGSSSGSAVAVARRQVTFALGTDTAGSGRVPAALCGVVGLKGAPGTHPLDGVQPASPTIDCVSTFSRSIADGLVVEGVLARRAWPVAVGPFRIATPDLALPEARALTDTGHDVRPLDLTLFHEAGDLLYRGAWLADRTSVLGPLLAANPAGLDPIIQAVVDGGRAYSGTDVFDAQRRLTQIEHALAPLWAQTDVMMVPTIDLVPTSDEVATDPIGTNERLGRNTTFANLLGLAAITIPAPRGPGGVTILGPAGHAGAVAAVAGDLRRESLARGSTGSLGRHHLAVVGAHLQGQPLHHQLTERGADLVERTRTAPSYRLYRLASTPPLRPGLDRVESRGAPIEVEVWALDDAGLGSLTATVAAPLGIGSVELSDGRWVKGFICEGRGLATATDITSHGGWRAYLEASRA